jgi:signal transduction histidine kinase
VKNPLSAIKSIAQVMREDEKLCGEYTRDLDLIVGETDRLNRSVTQMLNFSRHPTINSAKNKSLDDLVHAVTKLVRTEAEERGITIEVNLGDTQLELGGARAEAFRDALSNLLLNAIQATPAGGGVKVETMSDDDKLVATISDSGGGVPENLRERIWEPFFTTRQRGTGLGLAIVRRRVEDVSGTVRIAPPRPGEGARFEVIIPLK